MVFKKKVVLKVLRMGFNVHFNFLCKFETTINMYVLVYAVNDARYLFLSQVNQCLSLRISLLRDRNLWPLRDTRQYFGKVSLFPPYVGCKHLLHPIQLLDRPQSSSTEFLSLYLSSFPHSLVANEHRRLLGFF